MDRDAFGEEFDRAVAARRMRLRLRQTGLVTIVLWAELPDGKALPVTNYSLFR